MMKKMIMALCIFICVLTLVACSGQQTNEPLILGVNAIITEIDKENKIITTKDSGEEGVLGDDCLIDCSQIPMIYCNYTDIPHCGEHECPPVSAGFKLIFSVDIGDSSHVSFFLIVDRDIHQWLMGYGICNHPFNLLRKSI